MLLFRISLTTMMVIVLIGYWHECMPCPVADNTLYVADFSKQDPQWDFDTETTNFSANKLKFSPALKTTQTVAYNGDFFDTALVCSIVTLIENDDKEQVAGIVFWFKDYRHNYVFGINPKSSHFYVGRRVGNQMAFPIVDKVSDQIKPGILQPNELQIKINGETASFSINGTTVGEIKGQAWAEGNLIGVFAESGEKKRAIWEFSNFTVSKLE